MKFIHCADLHLASSMESRLSPEKSKQRRKELTETFCRIADYAVENGVTAILISGDIFDESKPSKAQKRNFTDIVKNHRDVDFLCLAGNHDESLSEEENLPSNLLTFGENWKKYTYGDVDIYGCEQNETNCNLLYTSLRTNEDRTNIVMLHGQIKTSRQKPTNGDVILPSLADKGIDYLALGHIHSYETGELDGRGIWVYSGCPEGRGYDECGNKGIVLLDIQNGKVSHSFVPFANRTIVEVPVDISGLSGRYEIENKVLETLANEDRKNMVRVLLSGRVDISAGIDTEDIENTLNSVFFASSVKNMTRPIIDPAYFSDLLSLRGEFVRTVYDDPDLSDDDKEQILRCGLLALNKERVEF